MDDDREEPREYDIDMFTVACTDAVLESLEDLQLKVEEIQLSCEDYANRNTELQQRLVDKENELVMTRTKLEEQIVHLKKINLQILAQKFIKDNNMQKWVKYATDMVDKEQERHCLQTKVDQLSVQCMEKDKMISSLQWQLADKDTTLTTTTADRNRLAAEVDELAMRVDELEFVEALQRQESIRSRPEGPSFDSDDESMDLKRNSSCIQADEEKGSTRLRRAANFTNINSLDLSSDFLIEKIFTSASPVTLGQGDLSKSDNMLSKEFCRSVNRLYELRDDMKILSQSNHSIDRQVKFRASLAERRLNSSSPTDGTVIQIGSGEIRKPRLYVNGDYCEHINPPISKKTLTSPDSRRKNRATENCHEGLLQCSQRCKEIKDGEEMKDSYMATTKYKNESKFAGNIENDKSNTKNNTPLHNCSEWQNRKENQDQNQTLK